MSTAAVLSENTFFSVLACAGSALQSDADELVDGLAQLTSTGWRRPRPSVDYFATSLPSLLLFTDDPQRQRDLQVAFLRAQLSDLAGSSQRRPRNWPTPAPRPASEAALDLQRWISWDADSLAISAARPSSPRTDEERTVSDHLPVPVPAHLPD